VDAHMKALNFFFFCQIDLSCNLNSKREEESVPLLPQKVSGQCCFGDSNPTSGQMRPASALCGPWPERRENRWGAPRDLQAPRSLP
jgi:hypothetical protein